MGHWLAAVAAGLFVVRLVLFVVLHVLPGGVDPVRETVSDYAASSSTRTRRLAAVASWAAAAAWVVFGAAILAGVGAQRSSVGLWLIVLGLVLTVMPFVPTDRTGTAATPRGRLHLLLAIAWFTLAYATIGPVQGLVQAGSAAHSALGVLKIVAAVSLIALVISMLVRRLRTRTFGISERVFILAVTVAPLVGALAILSR
jgi:hypothetical protein